MCKYNYIRFKGSFVTITSNTITIENTPPTWDGFLLNGLSSHSYGPVYTDTALALTANNPYDADGDTLVIEWEFWNDLNGDGVDSWDELTIVSNAVDGYVYPTNLYSKGDSIQFRYLPDEYTDASTPVRAQRLLRQLCQ